jgi:hypothetical protein
MRLPGAYELMELFDASAREPAFERVSRLLAAAFPDSRPDVQPFGWRNARLLDLRAALFGRRMSCMVSCHHCGQAADIELATEDLRADPAGTASPIEVVHNERRFVFRLPAAGDVAAAVQSGDPAGPRHALARRCLLDPADVRERLDDDLLNRLAARFAAADPQADVTLALVCPSCGRELQSRLDLTAFVWAEIETLVAQLMAEVHALAAAYGWSERAILTLPAARRRRYVEMAT